MTAFISHSFSNKAEFRNVADFLTQVNVPYWEPTSIRSGEGLRNQLRSTIRECSVCVFIATHDSVNSAWCGAELGAFWGAGIKIVTYVADSSLQPDDLPPVVQGDVWERELRRVAETARRIHDSAKPRVGTDPAPQTPLANLTAMELTSLIASAVSLSRAQEQSPAGTGAPMAADILADRVIRAADAAHSTSRGAPAGQPDSLLWVDDRPENNIHERRMFESLGLAVELALSTDEAMARLENNRYGVIISDMGRKEGAREGYRLLAEVRQAGIGTPYFIYAASGSEAHRREALSRGAQGSTNRPTDLIEMVTEALDRSAR